MTDRRSVPDAELVSAYLDGECSEEERRHVQLRLAESPELRALLEQLASVRDAVRRLEPRDVPDELWVRLRSDPDLAGGDAVVRRFRPAAARRVPPRTAALAASAVAAVIAAVALVPGPETTTPPVAVFTDAHAVRTSLQDDAVSSMAPLGVPVSFGR